MILPLATAYADEGPPADAAMEELDIHEAPEVRRARAQVALALRGLGYADAGRRGDARVLVAKDPWMPMVLLYDSGWVDVRRRPLVAVDPGDAFREKTALWQGHALRAMGGRPSAEEAAIIDETAGTMLLCDAWTGVLCVSPAGWLVGKKRIARVEEDVFAAAGPPIAAWRDTVAARRHTARMTREIPAELAGLWEAAAPATERRAWLYAWWDGRTDTPDGRAARAAAEAFLSDVVQASAEPFPREELDALNAGRVSAEPLVLSADGPQPG